MTSTSLAVLSPPTPLRCCPKECEYRPEAVEHFIRVLADFRRRGEDPSVKLRSQEFDQETGGGTAGDQGVMLWDVQQAIRSLRREGREITLVSVAERLCPWSLEE